MNKQDVVSLRRWVGRKAIGLGLRIMDPATRREFLRKPDVPSMTAAYAALKRLDFSPRAAVDVGANQGEWTRTFHTFFSETRILMVDPQPSLVGTLDAVCDELGDTVDFANCLLGASNRERVPFHVLDDDAGGSGSSVFPEHSNVPRHFEALPMTTLDQLVKETRFPAPDFLKIDVQGYEIEVLRGAQVVLASAEFVLLEVSILPYNIGAPCMHEVLAWMAGAGFVTWELCGLHRLPGGTLCQIDLLFARENSRYRSSARVLFNEWPKDVEPKGLPGMRTGCENR